MTGLDPDILQRQASDPRASVFVSASAGSGKTKVLTDRVLRLLLGDADRQGAPPERLLCLTFTKAAAAEMAERVRRRLADWAVLPDPALEEALFTLTGVRPGRALRARARALFARVVDLPQGLRILTLHAFCQSVLRRFPLEAGVPARFELAEERLAAGLIAQARDRVLRAARQEAGGALARALDVLGGHVLERAFDALIADALARRAVFARLSAEHGGLPGLNAALARLLGVPPGSDPQALLAAGCRAEEMELDRLRAAAAALGASDKSSDRTLGAALADWLEEPQAARFDACRAAFLTQGGAPRKALMTKGLAGRHPDLAEALLREQERICALVARCNAAELLAANEALWTLVDAILESYRQEKARRALLDFQDLIDHTAALLRRQGVAAWVLWKLDGGIDHILVDEAQDTNADQWAIIDALAAEFFAGAGARGPDEGGLARTLFAVGDHKQSIFSFQGAEPRIFADQEARYAAAISGPVGEFRRVAMDISFRSVPVVLETVDAVFADEAARRGVTVEDDTGRPQPMRHRAHRRGEGGLVALWPELCDSRPDEPPPWALPEPGPPEPRASWRLAQQIAQTVRGWLDGGEILVARGRPVRPGDVLVLVRRRTAFVPALVRALKERQVPVSGVDRMTLVDQIAVQDLMALAEWLLLPRHDLALAGLLRSPLVGWSDEQLLALAHDRPEGASLNQALRTAAEAGAPDAVAARGWLERAAGWARRATPFGLFARVLETACPADPGAGGSGRRAMVRRLGHDALDPLEEFLTAALEFERTGTASLQAFLAWIGGGDVEIKRELDQGRGEVRIMTVHASKGLQAPIVFLPDTMAQPRPETGVLWPGPDRPAGQRLPLWPVRAELSVPAIEEAKAARKEAEGEEQRRLLYVALTRAEDRLYVAGHRGVREAPLDCWYRLVEQAFGRCADVVLMPDDGRQLIGVQTAGAAAATSTEAPAAAPGGQPGWALAAPAAEPALQRPLAPSRSTTDFRPPRPSPLRGATGTGDRGGARARGSLIHRLFELLPAVPPAGRAAALDRLLAAHGVAAAAGAEIAASVLPLFEHPETAPLFGPDSLAEVPIAGLVGGRTVTGQIDRLALLPQRILVVDFKTGWRVPADAAAVPAEHRQQMQLYAGLVALAHPDRPVRPLLLYTAGPRLIALPEVPAGGGIESIAGLAPA